MDTTTTAMFDAMYSGLGDFAPVLIFVLSVAFAGAVVGWVYSWFARV